jgi:N-acetylmuramoyl-L-alanine amidase
MIKKIVINQNDSADVRGIDENEKECFYLDTNHSLEVLLKSAQAQNFLTVPYSVQVLKPKPVVVPVPPPIPQTPNPKTIPHTWKNGGDNSVLPTVSLLPNGHYLIKSDGDVDCDGSLRIGSIDPVNGQSETSLRRSNGWKGANANCDSEFIPFFVLPMNWVKTTGDTKSHLGDMAKITYKDKTIYAIYADQGPNALIGEASVCAVEKLGFNPWNADKTKVVRGIPVGVAYEVISGSANLARTIDFDSIQAYGKELFEGVIPTPVPLPSKVVMLNAGHAGASGATNKDGTIKEEVFNALIVSEVKKIIDNAKVPCDIVNQNVVAGLSAVGKAAQGYKISIAFHYNATDRKEHGVGYLGGQNKPTTIAFANKLCKELAEPFGYNVLGHIDMSVTVTSEFDKTNCPIAFLLETEFIDDETNLEAFKQRVIKQAEIVAKNILESLNINPNPIPEPKPMSNAQKYIEYFKSNFLLVDKEVEVWFAGKYSTDATKNACVAHQTSCLKLCNFPYPQLGSMESINVDYFADWAIANKWTKITDVTKLQPGDICISGPSANDIDHVFCFVSYVDKDNAKVLDNQAVGLHDRSLAGVGNGKWRFAVRMP